MLRRLSVENYALIDRLDMELSDSLNIITGETGAGKSILLGALSLLLGSRADASSIKDNERNCVVEGTFSLGGYNLEKFFEQNDLDYDATSVVRRVISSAGKSRAYINELPVQLATLKEFGTHLIDIHSQHQSLMIAEEDFRTNIVDSVASHAPLLVQYREAYNRFKSSERELSQLLTQASEISKDEEYIRFQLEQLESAALSEPEQHEFEREQSELSHAEQIKEALTISIEELDQEELGVLSRLKSAENSIAHIAQVHKPSEELSVRLHATMVELKDIFAELSGENDRIESDPARLQFIELRLNTIYGLQQKHKVSSIADLIELREHYRERLNRITNSDDQIGALKIKIVQHRAIALALADKISLNRTKSASKVGKYVDAMLAKLGMPNGHFTVEIAPSGEIGINGADVIGFIFSANKSVAGQSIEKVASGGEISRVMLALKSLVAKSTKLPTIIFDEIDTGVSGQIADAMGEIIHELSQSMQVVNITHLPQVASKGETHFMVYKDHKGDRSHTLISKLSADERVDEIAKMLSGSHITDAAIEQAKLLLGKQ